MDSKYLGTRKSGENLDKLAAELDGVPLERKPRRKAA
jgi:hypothetical protein